MLIPGSDEDHNGVGKFRSIPYSNNIMHKFVLPRSQVLTHILYVYDLAQRKIWSYVEIYLSLQRYLWSFYPDLF